MKRAGLEKARARLKDALDAFEQLKVAAEWAAFESAWTRILTALSSTYAILQQSAKGSAKSEGWFAKVLGQRRADEVLSYLMHARNANDHGIADVIKLQRGGMGIRASDRSKGLYIEKLVAGDDGQIKELQGWQSDGSPPEIVHYPDRVKLVPVVDRGKEYQPPTTFLGNPLMDESPIAVAQQVLEFMVILFGEAEELVVTKSA